MEYSLALSEPVGQSVQVLTLVPGATSAKVIGGRGSARLENGSLIVNVPEKLDFIWVKLE